MLSNIAAGGKRLERRGCRGGPLPKGKAAAPTHKWFDFDRYYRYLIEFRKKLC
jgi:hypothetical protein